MLTLGARALPVAESSWTFLSEPEALSALYNACGNLRIDLASLPVARCPASSFRSGPPSSGPDVAKSLGERTENLLFCLLFKDQT